MVHRELLQLEAEQAEARRNQAEKDVETTQGHVDKMAASIRMEFASFKRSKTQDCAVMLRQFTQANVDAAAEERRLWEALEALLEAQSGGIRVATDGAAASNAPPRCEWVSPLCSCKR